MLSTQEVRHRLKAKYGRTTDAVRVPEHLVMFEVPIDGRPRFGIDPDSVPANYRHRVISRQRIDAVAVGIWRRTEYLVHGFEIKVSRADLLKELRDPTKSDAAVRASDRWWLVLGDRKLLKDSDTLPDGWGVLVPRGRGLGVLVEPRPQPGERDPKFIAGLMQTSLRAHGVCRGLGYVDGWSAGVNRYNRRLRQR